MIGLRHSITYIVVQLRAILRCAVITYQEAGELVNALRRLVIVGVELMLSLVGVAVEEGERISDYDREEQLQNEVCQEWMKGSPYSNTSYRRSPTIGIVKSTSG
jgi:hypothetical protein